MTTPLPNVSMTFTQDEIDIAVSALNNTAATITKTIAGEGGTANTSTEALQRQLGAVQALQKRFLTSARS
jgi:hypothetical protein